MQTSLVNEKKSAKEIMIGIGVIAILMLAGMLWIGTGEAKEEYRPLTPQAQVSYDATLESVKSAEKAHLASTCTLVDAKLMDYANSYEQYPLTVEQVKELSAKRESCKKGF